MKLDCAKASFRPARRAPAKRRAFGHLARSAATAILLTGISSLSVRAENPDIASRRAVERTDFGNAEIKDGFFKIAFGAELQLDAPADRVR
ncbi:MAG TPA: hypothetical protein VKT76_07495, partial [Bradyrhizobium sp.]|nr:hypothetical protein [Bradyrhizobium sp.]